MNNYQFFYTHFRIDVETDELKRYFRGQSDWKPAAKCGITVCHVLSFDGELVGSGRAWCSPQDAFCYRVGREIAKGKALGKKLYKTPSWVMKMEVVYV